MELSIQGKVIDVLEEQSGESRNGPWRKRDFILETNDRFPRKVCISQWGDAIDNDAVAVDDEINAFINIQSREYNGRWYTDVRAWRIEKADDGNNAAAPKAADTKKSNNGAKGPSMDSLDDVDDDLPF